MSVVKKTNTMGTSHLRVNTHSRHQVPTEPSSASPTLDSLSSTAHISNHRKTMSSSSLLDLAVEASLLDSDNTSQDSEIGQQVAASEYMVCAMARNAPTWVVNDEDKNEIIRHLEQEFMEDFRRQYLREQATDYKRTTTFSFLDVAPLIKNSINCIIKDSFTRCFQSHPARRWNWNVYLFLPYVFGIVFRYLLLFPLRLLVLLLGIFLFFVLHVFGEWFFRRNPRKLRLHRQRCSRVAGYTFRMAMHAVIRVHGQLPKRRANQLVVSNHTSLVDVMVMYQLGSFSVVGQSHPGFIGFLEKVMLSGMECVWFDRSQASDRQTVARKIEQHVRDVEKPPLLIFPEGTCVNNKYIVMFKRGAFELDAEVIPVAIKYNKIFVDAYWNSRQESFLMNFIKILTSWALVCDLYILEPQLRLGGETAIMFSERVKLMIARKAKLTPVPWDGYLKHYQPKSVYLEDRQRIIAESLRVRFRFRIFDKEPEKDAESGVDSSSTSKASSAS